MIHKWRERTLKGKITIKGKMRPYKYNASSMYSDVVVKLDGKVLERLQMVDLHFNLDSVPFVLLKIIPDELDIEVEDIEVVERTKGNLEDEGG